MQMDFLISGVFIFTYIGMGLGRIPGLKLDRSGIAMIAAIILVATRAVSGPQIAAAIHFPTLLLLSSLMILSARFGAAGFYQAAVAWIACQATRPSRLLALTIALSGALSFVLVNDIVVFTFTPILCEALCARKIDARPFLFGLAAASNAGSAATLIGNPQNILIGQVGGLGFWSYFSVAIVPTLIGLILTYVCISIVWRSSLLAETHEAPFVSPAIDRFQLSICGIAVLALLFLFSTSLPRELSALIVAAGLIISRMHSSRRLFNEIDLPLLILFASLFIVTDAFSRTKVAEDGLRFLSLHGYLPDRISILAPVSLLLSNTIGNVPAVMMILKIWHGISQGTLTGLAVLSTLAGNFLLVGSLANLIAADRAATAGIHLSFADHAKAGVPITLLSIFFTGGWLWITGVMVL